MRDDEERALRRAERVDAIGDDAQRVDVEAGIRLVHDAERRLEQRHLQDLVPLLLAAGKADVERPPQHVLRDLRASPTAPHELHEFRRRQLRLAARLALRVDAVLRNVIVPTPGISTGYWKARNTPATARSSGSMSSRSGR